VLDDIRLGGSLPFWIILGLVGIVLVDAGLMAAPAINGFLLLIAGGLLLGISYGQLLLRIPGLTRRPSIGVLIALLITVVVLGAVALGAARAPTPEPLPSVLVTPPR
jgi:hypothetical protein